MVIAFTDANMCATSMA